MKHNFYNTVNYKMKCLGKGENIWDHLVHTRPELIKDRSNGNIACDSYHKYKEDIALAKNLNVRLIFYHTYYHGIYSVIIFALAKVLSIFNIMGSNCTNWRSSLVKLGWNSLL